MPERETRPSPAYQEISHRKTLLDACPIDVYIASNNRTYWYPYRLQKVGYASDRIRPLARRGYILDSGIGDDDVTNADVLEKARGLDERYINPNTWVVPKDYLHDRSRTTESVLDFFDLYDDFRYSEPATVLKPAVIVPLQPPHVEHYEALRDHGVTADRWAIGGVKDRPPAEQLDALRTFREAVGPEPDVHGMGFGANQTLIRGLREDPGLVSSLDLSTPEQYARFSKLPGERWEKEDGYVTPGDSSFILRGAVASIIAMRLVYELSDLPDTEKAPRLEESVGEQTSLGDH